MWIFRDFSNMLFLFIIWLVIRSVTALTQEPRFSLVSRNVTVTADQTAVLPCSVDYLGSYKVVWQSPRGKTLTLEDRRIISDERISLERPYVKEWNLHLRKVKTSDAGTYQCQINTDPVQVRGVMLHVNEPPKIIDHLSTSATVTVNEGDTVELVCNVTGFPTPTVTWHRISTVFADDDEHRGKKRIGMDGEVLIIHNVSRYCDDKYECVASNGVLPDDTREMKVHVQFPPEVRLPTKKMSQGRGKTTILECEITAYPHSVTAWRRGGKDIVRNNKYSTELYSDGPNKFILILKIQNLEEDDYGEYECYAQNLLGHDTETMVLCEHKPVEKTTTAITTSNPWSSNIDEPDDNSHNQIGRQGQLDSHGPHETGYDHWNTRSSDAKHVKSPSSRADNWEEYPPYSDLKSRQDYESDRQSGSVISGPRGSGSFRNGVQKWMHPTQGLVCLLLLIHKVTVR